MVLNIEITVLVFFDLDGLVNVKKIFEVLVD